MGMGERMSMGTGTGMGVGMAMGIGMATAEGMALGMPPSTVGAERGRTTAITPVGCGPLMSYAIEHDGQRGQTRKLCSAEERLKRHPMATEWHGSCTTSSPSSPSGENEIGSTASLS